VKFGPFTKSAPCPSKKTFHTYPLPRQPHHPYRYQFVKGAVKRAFSRSLKKSSVSGRNRVVRVDTNVLKTAFIAQ